MPRESEKLLEQMRVMVAELHDLVLAFRHGTGTAVDEPVSSLADRALARLRLKGCRSRLFRLEPETLQELARRLIDQGEATCDAVRWLRTYYSGDRKAVYRFADHLRRAADEVLRGVPYQPNTRQSSASPPPEPGENRGGSVSPVGNLRTRTPFDGALNAD